MSDKYKEDRKERKKEGREKEKDETKEAEGIIKDKGWDVCREAGRLGRRSNGERMK